MVSSPLGNKSLKFTAIRPIIKIGIHHRHLSCSNIEIIGHRPSKLPGNPKEIGLDIKPLIGQWLDIDPHTIHQIELDDITLTVEAERNLNAIIDRMLDATTPLTTTAGEFLANVDDLIDCRGFWMESSKDLLLYIQLLNQVKTILIPPHYWKVRQSKTIH